MHEYDHPTNNYGLSGYFKSHSITFTKYTARLQQVEDYVRGYTSWLSYCS